MDPHVLSTPAGILVYSAGLSSSSDYTRGSNHKELYLHHRDPSSQGTFNAPTNWVHTQYTEKVNFDTFCGAYQVQHDTRCALHKIMHCEYDAIARCTRHMMQEAGCNVHSAVHCTL